MNKKFRTETRKGPGMIGFLPYHFHIAAVEFDRLKKYQTVVERHLKDEAANFRNSIEITAKSQELSGEALDVYYESHSDTLEMWEQSFFNSIHTGMLVSSCALLESSLLRICKEIEQHDDNNIRCRWDDIERDKGIMRAGKFLRKNFCIHIELHPFWTRICNYYKIRNVTVHAGGDLFLLNDNKRRKVDKIAEHLKHVNGGLPLKTSFIDSVLTDITVFWKALEQAFIQDALIGPKHWP